MVPMVDLWYATSKNTIRYAPSEYNQHFILPKPHVYIGENFHNLTEEHDICHET